MYAVSRDEDDRPPPCEFCGALFMSRAGMRLHKKMMLEEEDKKGDAEAHVHLWCEICDWNFKSKEAAGRHWGQFHAEKQQLECPGCGRSFVKLSSFIRHIEFDECPKITTEDVKLRREAKLTFTRGLAQYDEEGKGSVHIKNLKDFSPYLGDPKPINPNITGNSLPSEVRDSGGRDPQEPALFASKEDDFPRMGYDEYLRGSSNVPDLLTGDNNDALDEKIGENPWALKVNLFPNAPPALRPTLEQSQQLAANQRAATESVRGTNTDPHDPDSPLFHAEEYYNQFTKKYKCPKQRCKKSFSSKAALEQHLRSPAHARKKTTCPGCLATFDTFFALTSHVESQSLKCKIRSSDVYEIFLQQLTWDLAEVRRVGGKKMFAVSQGAQNTWGSGKTQGPTLGQIQIHESQGAGAKAIAADRNAPPLTEAALAQHEQQIRIERKKQQQQQGGGSHNVALTAEALEQLQLQEVKKSANQPRGKQHSGCAWGDGDDAWGSTWGEGGGDWGNGGDTWGRDSDPWGKSSGAEGDTWGQSGGAKRSGGHGW